MSMCLSDPQDLSTLQCEVCILVFSVTDRRSFHRTAQLRLLLRESQPHTPIILVGNKSDLVRSREISSEGRWREGGAPTSIKSVYQAAPESIALRSPAEEYTKLIPSPGHVPSFRKLNGSSLHNCAYKHCTLFVWNCLNSQMKITESSGNSFRFIANLLAPCLQFHLLFRMRF